MNERETSFTSDIDGMQTTETFKSTLTLDRETRQEDNDYDPFEHRHLEHPNSTIGSFLHLLKSSLGTGLLAMPAAFKHAGLLAGSVGTILVAFVAAHCVHILVRTSHEICRVAKVPCLDYACTCEEVFKRGPEVLRKWSRTIRNFVDYTMAAVCLGGTAVYVIFIASSLKGVFDNYVPEKKLSVEIYCLIIFLPLVLMCQLRHLKFLVPFSVLANICLLITFGITCYYTFTGLPHLSEREYVTDVVQWPSFISTAIFAMEGINVVMPVENEMRNPRKFLGCPGVLCTTMCFVTALYGIIGFFGYLKYGEKVLGSITLNLPHDELLGDIAKILVAISVFFTYCLQMYAPLEIIWGRLQQRVTKKYHNISQISYRSVTVALTVGLAAALPDLELLIGLVGAIFFSTLGLLVPLVVETVHRWNRDLGYLRWIFWKNLLLLAMYLIVLIAGCYSSMRQIVLKISGT